MVVSIKVAPRPCSQASYTTWRTFTGTRTPPFPLFTAPFLIAISLVIAILVAVMVTVAAILVLWAAHAQRLLDGHLLPAQLHGVDQVVDDGHGPHGRGVPGLDIAVLSHQEHGEVLRADLEVVADVLHQRGRQSLAIHGGRALGTKEGL